MVDGPDIPDERKKEIALAVTKAALGSVPVLGGAAAELLDLVMRPAVESRRTDWLNDLSDTLAELQTRVEGIETGSLLENQEFVSTLFQASAVALREHRREKLDALKNAVLNTAVTTNGDEDEHALFLSWVDDLTPWHLRLLKFFDDKEGIAGERGKLPFPGWAAGGVSTVLEHVYPELVGRRSMYDLIATDLHGRGLIKIDSLHITGTREGYMLARQTSDMGQRFMAFISEPPQLN